MAVISIRDVTGENVDDLCRICVPLEQRDDLTFAKGMGQKGKWAREMLRRWGSCAKLACAGTVPVGLIQYEPVTGEKVVYIHCVYVPEKEHWQREIAPRMPIRWIDRSAEPEEAGKRGSVEGCVVNACQIKSLVLDKEGFRKEVAAALQKA
jgi:hypothetical protein